MPDVLDRMLDGGVISGEDAQFARAAMAEGVPLDDALRERPDLSETDVLRFLADEFGVPWVDLETVTPEHDFLARFPARILLDYRILPLSQQNGTVLVATSQIFDSTGLDELRIAAQVECRPALAPRGEIERRLRQCLGIGADTVQSLVSDGEIQVIDRGVEDSVDLTQAAEDASIIKFVNEVLMEAIGLRATDVHFEPFENELRVRYRIDGVLQDAAIPAEVRQFRAAIISRLKILSNLDIAEKRLPQDGRIKLLIAGREIDVRVSVIPMVHGEAVVLRLLDRSAALLGLEQLGMSAADCSTFERILALPHGIILVTGPTGSGKTTTLYAALSRINDSERKIITIEDPVEYQLHGINQIQVSGKAGLSFSRGLRAILRHDPDVILIGEIRDLETAQIAVQASLTGHLVFSTLHTNDAPGAITRLVDMGIEPYLVASSLEAVLAQRLVRLVCPECKESYRHHDPELLAAQMELEPPEELYRGRGCRQCQGTGYRSRRGIFEMMTISETLESMIVGGASAGELRRKAIEEGMATLRQDGWRHVRSGATTVEEVLRVTKDERMKRALAPEPEPLSGGSAVQDSKGPSIQSE